MINERRKAKRVEFSNQDGVFFVIAKAEPKGAPITLTASNLCEDGINFNVTTHLKNSFQVGEKLFLEKIIGTRSLHFFKSMEVTILWKQENRKKNLVYIGCQIGHAENESRKQLRQFIQSEISFAGMRAESPRHDTRQNIEQKQSADVAGVRKINTHRNHDTTYWRMIGLIMGIFLTFSFFYLYWENLHLRKAVIQLEKKNQTVQEFLLSTEKNAADIRSVETRLSELLEGQQRNETDLDMLKNKVDALDPKATGAKKDSAPDEAPEPDRDLSISKSESEGVYHEVMPGENLFRISLKYNISIKRLAEANDLLPDDTIYSGRLLKLPRP